MSKQSELVGLARTTNLDEVNAAYSAGALSNRNLIINGAMQVAQRGVGPVAVAPYQYNTADRMRFSLGGAGSTWTQEIVSDQDVGDFIGSAMKNTCTTAAASEAGNNIRLELQDMERFVGKTLTLSFYAKSDAPLTITPQVFGDTLVSLGTFTLTTSYQRYQASFIVPALTTKTFFDLGMRVDDSVLTAHYITGVQLEVGDTATPFEHRSYGQELALCQRYYNEFGGVAYCAIATGMQANTTISMAGITFPTMRAAPSIGFYDLIATDRTVFDETATQNGSIAGTKSAFLRFTHAGRGAPRDAILLAVRNQTSGKLTLDAEL